MARLSTGGFIVLPGGYGTFEEALEMITWNQLRIHQLPVVILNSMSLLNTSKCIHNAGPADKPVDNFYTPLRDMFESASTAGFINPENLSLVTIVDLPGEGANRDTAKAGEWGQAALKALSEFKFSVS